ncbi:ATP-dependent zinc metalloprotease FtsH [Candidatus Woesebacteria bacterium]|nr:ATP-dependent zinc metalloprotease FtsH [Candidatus Woesebacteria bacterium]
MAESIKKTPVTATGSKGKATPKPAPAKPTTPTSPSAKPKPKLPDTGIKHLEFKINLDWLMSKGVVYLLLALLFLPFIYTLVAQEASNKINLSQLMQDVKDQKVERIEVKGDELRGIYKDSGTKVAIKEPGQQALEVLKASDLDLTQVMLDVKQPSALAMIWELIIAFLPVVLMLVFFFFIFKQARGSQDGMMGIGRSKAKLFIKGKQNVSFKDVGGMDEAKKELEEIVDFLKDPKKYTKVGARTPKGVLLVGPSGTGKTLLARAVAGEANVQFLSIAGSEFMEMLVGVGASRARDLFATAKKIAPSIIFIDEIDAIGRVRGMGSMGGHDEREQTLNQILVEMDGFTQNDNVMVMAATNRGDMLDPALVRPGRFDRRVTVNLPDLIERKFILSIHAKKKPFVAELDWEKVAKRTVGFSGADLENMLNEAAIAVAREAREQITMADIEEASLKVKLGPSKKRLQDDYERKMTTYHEAGHAIVAHFSPYADPVHRISIVSRGRALGFTLTPPEKDKVQTTMSELIDNIAVLMGGRVAEKIFFNELTAGASSDIERATSIARAMVMDYGMSDLGAMNFSPQYETDYGRAGGEALKISDRLQEKVDDRVKQFVDQGEERAIELIEKHKKQMIDVSDKLLELESLDSDEFIKAVGSPKVKRS